VSAGSREQAGELVDEGFCDYTESAIRFGEQMANGETESSAGSCPA